MPGLRLNVGLGGLSLTAGVRGASVNLGPRGLYRNLGLPGTGLSNRSRIGSPWPAGSTTDLRVSLKLDLDPNGRLTLLGADDLPLESGIERRIRREQEPRLRAWLTEQCAEIDAGFDAITNVHRGTPAPFSRTHFVPVAFRESEPQRPGELVLGFWDRVLAGRRRNKERAHALLCEVHEQQHAGWQERRSAHATAQERERRRVEEAMLSEPAVMEDELTRALSAIPWPRETLVEFAFEEGGAQLVIDVDLPEIEDLPARHAEIAARGLKLNIRDRSAIELRRAYAAHVHGVAFLLVGTAFAELPALEQVVCSGYSQRRDPRTAHEREDYLYSVRVTRALWTQVDFTALEYLDVTQCLERFELVRELSASGVFAPVRPLARLPRSEPAAVASASGAPESH
jgi:hypothetical protein